MDRLQRKSDPVAQCAGQRNENHAGVRAAAEESGAEGSANCAEHDARGSGCFSKAGLKVMI